MTAPSEPPRDKLDEALYHLHFAGQLLDRLKSADGLLDGGVWIAMKEASHSLQATMVLLQEGDRSPAGYREGATLSGGCGAASPWMSEARRGSRSSVGVEAGVPGPR